ncbi:hypothetical protein SAMN04487910_2656 [Aquimarina amphilecti]|uniref:Uncharacterized protein n=1 Tax=Aquimarina amphilecti TaxID=1038014 RepID=A0A1H7QRT6_AQUAM|nr:hypothetical protein [Aquimarina amphilecti]SEL50428.1 hypothetical protein SAMN04487910_2656 [Aquimarina amphilecti]
MTNKIIYLFALIILTTITIACGQDSTYYNDDFKILNVEVIHDQALHVNIWNIEVKGSAGKTVPTPIGELDGAPVLGYVFPTNLKSTDVGFNMTEGIVALALTSHPDFDDTPLWDENMDLIYNNDGVIWHPHWVILVQDKRVSGGLAVKQFKKDDKTVILPPTNPGMPMYMDSPGFQVINSNNTIKVIVPASRMNGITSFNYDGVTAYMQVNTSLENKPMLGLYNVFSIASEDLSLPYKVTSK